MENCSYLLSCSAESMRMTEETRSLLLNVKDKYGDRSIALGMEPGQPGILEDYPRPKQQVCLLSISESAVFFQKP